MSNGLKGFKPDTARWPVLRHGLIFFKGGSVVCFVLNRSRGGAGLVLQSDDPLPLVFELEIDGENMRRRCVAIWRDQCRLGVSFDIERLAQVEQDVGPSAEEVMPQPTMLGREESVARFRSVLRFVGLTHVYRTAVMARSEPAANEPENPEIPAKYNVGGG